MSDSAAFTPLFLLTGFLGSGKTTLLARLLRDPALADSAVLINEFGEVGLDHHLLERLDETMVLLQSGCLCCTIRGELAAALRDLHSRRARGLVPPFRRLIVETTGLADPTPALSTLTADPVLRHHIRLGAVITTVDGINGLDQLARQPESVKQVAVADRLVVAKTDLCAPGSLKVLEAALRAINPDADLVHAGREEIAAGRLLAERSAALPVASALVCEAIEAGSPTVSRHGSETVSFCLILDQPIDWSLFGLWMTMLLHRHGDKILRVKGLLNVEGSDTPVALHGVQQVVHVPTHLTAWPDADRRSRIVFITRGLAPASIVRSMRAFGLMPPEARTTGLDQAATASSMSVVAR